MTHRIILFRGMNTGGVRAPVDEQRRMAQDMGLKNPRTLQASGNLVVESSKATAALEAEIETEMERRFGLKIAAMAVPRNNGRHLSPPTLFPARPPATPPRFWPWS